METTIKINEMLPYYLYRIRCRNMRYGIWLPAQQGCMGIREKFGDRFLFTEFHYDTGPPFGTLDPLMELEKTPFEEDDFKVVKKTGKYGEYLAEAKHNEIFEYLKQKEKEYDEKNG